MHLSTILSTILSIVITFIDTWSTVAEKALTKGFLLFNAFCRMHTGLATRNNYTCVHKHDCQACILKTARDRIFIIHNSLCSPLPRSWKGVYWFHVFRPSVRLSIRLWTKSCPLCIFHNTSRIHFILAHLIKQFRVWQMFGICNFDFVLLWQGICYESIVWVIMGGVGWGGWGGGGGGGGGGGYILRMQAF